MSWTQAQAQLLEAETFLTDTGTAAPKRRACTPKQTLLFRVSAALCSMRHVNSKRGVCVCMCVCMCVCVCVRVCVLTGVVEPISEDEAQVCYHRHRHTHTHTYTHTALSALRYSSVCVCVCVCVCVRSTQVDFLGESTEGNLHLARLSPEALRLDVFGMKRCD